MKERNVVKQKKQNKELILEENIMEWLVENVKDKKDRTQIKKSKTTLIRLWTIIIQKRKSW